MIIGLTGKNASGKGEVVSYLKQKGFSSSSLSDEIRLELKIRGEEESRENLIRVGNELRTKEGPATLAVRVSKRVKTPYVIDSIRNPSEVEELKKIQGFKLIVVSAPPKVRFDRAMARGRSEGAKTYEEFQKIEEMENSNNPNSQQLNNTECLADIELINDSGFEELHKKIDELLLNKDCNGRINMDKQEIDNRPSWDEYFMGITREVAKRATCDRGKCGSVIVKSKRLLSTGYVGSPIGAPHCDEVGHQMTEVYDKEGNKSSHCIRTTHAEQNAIVQAARHGISIEGATIYTKMEPCHVCAKMIINSGIKRVVAEKKYHAAQITRDLFKKAGVELVVLDKEIKAYDNQ